MNRSRPTTTNAVTSTWMAGKSGTKLASIVGLLSTHFGRGRHRRFRENPFQSQFHSRLQTDEKRLWIDAHPEDQKKNRRQQGQFTAIQILQPLIFRTAQRAENDPTKHPEHIDRT